MELSKTFWVPMIVLFCGYTFGVSFYGILVYTGLEDLINLPWFGLKTLPCGARRRMKRRSGKYEVQF